jgi:hypothetical protein
MRQAWLFLFDQHVAIGAAWVKVVPIPCHLETGNVADDGSPTQLSHRCVDLRRYFRCRIVWGALRLRPKRYDGARFSPPI